MEEKQSSAREVKVISTEAAFERTGELVQQLDIEVWTIDEIRTEGIENAGSIELLTIFTASEK